nr:hypothetical protein [uncultured bacterium]
MRLRAFLGVLLAALPAMAMGGVAMPDSAAGRVFAAWLDAFNSGERARLEAFARAHAPGRNADDYLGWRGDTGAYELLEIFGGDQRNVFFRVKARSTGAEEVGRLQVSAASLVTVAELGTWRVPPGVQVDAVRLDAKSRARVVDSVADAFDSTYVYPDVGKQMAAAVRGKEAGGAYRDAIFGQDLARRLADDLREISHDKHVDVQFSFFARPAEPPAAQSERESRRLVAVNCGFAKAEHLKPNIGYLKFDVFGDPKVCAPTAAAAMTLLSDAEALILDLRQNAGGAPGMSEFIATYLFDQRTHLDDMYNRVEDTITESWTLPYVPGRKFLDKPVYVLVSSRTFSAAEALSYELKHLKRATLVGETTLGGAHPTDTRRLDDHFSARVPFARSINPITRTNWEGVGVEPDVKVPAAEALDTALKLATEAIRKDGK